MFDVVLSFQLGGPARLISRAKEIQMIPNIGGLSSFLRRSLNRLSVTHGVFIGKSLATICGPPSTPEMN